MGAFPAVYAEPRFTNDGLVQAAATPLILVVALLQPLAGLVFTWDGLFQGLSDYAYLALAMAVASIVTWREVLDLVRFHRFPGSLNDSDENCVGFTSWTFLSFTFELLERHHQRVESLSTCVWQATLGLLQIDLLNGSLEGVWVSRLESSFQIPEHAFVLPQWFLKRTITSMSHAHLSPFQTAVSAKPTNMYIGILLECHGVEFMSRFSSNAVKPRINTSHSGLVI